MYIPAAFQESDAVRIAEFVDRHPLAALIGLIDGQLVANHVPFIRTTGLAPGTQLIAHTARANPARRLGESGADVLLVFLGADAYVSPSYYPSKSRDPRTVPTYNYVAVHVRGRLGCSHDRADKLRAVELLTTKMESGRPNPWSVSDAPQDYLDKMLGGIVALTLHIESVEAKWKASQNRSTEDQRGVIEGLRAGPPGSPALEAAAAVECSMKKPARNEGV